MFSSKHVAFRKPVALAAGLILTLTARSAVASQTLITLDDPAALPGQTSPFGIDGSTVVGFFQDSTGYHGFTETGGVYTTLDVPWVTGSTYVQGVSGNTVVGFYETAGTFQKLENGLISGQTGAIHGFIEKNGVYTQVDVPGASWTSVQGISGDTIVGYYDDNTGRHSFEETAGVFTTLNVPWAPEYSYATGIYGSKIVGVYLDSMGYHGYIEDNGVYTQLNHPLQYGANTDPWGISGDLVVGEYYDGKNNLGFWEVGGQYGTLPTPIMSANGISGNIIVGIFFDDTGVQHGFMMSLAVPEPSTVGMVGGAIVVLLIRRRRDAKKRNYRRGR